jgi:hypothetical protein
MTDRSDSELVRVDIHNDGTAEFLQSVTGKEGYGDYSFEACQARRFDSAKANAWQELRLHDYKAGLLWSETQDPFWRPACD